MTTTPSAGSSTSEQRDWDDQPSILGRGREGPTKSRFYPLSFPLAQEEDVGVVSGHRDYHHQEEVMKEEEEQEEQEEGEEEKQEEEKQEEEKQEETAGATGEEGGCPVDFQACVDDVLEELVGGTDAMVAHEKEVEVEMEGDDEEDHDVTMVKNEHEQYEQREQHEHEYEYEIEVEHENSDGPTDWHFETNDGDSHFDHGRSGSPGSTPYRKTAAEDLAHEDVDVDVDNDGPPCQPILFDRDDEQAGSFPRLNPCFHHDNVNENVNVNNLNDEDNDIHIHPSVHFREKHKILIGHGQKVEDPSNPSPVSVFDHGVIGGVGGSSSIMDHDHQQTQLPQQQPATSLLAKYGFARQSDGSAKSQCTIWNHQEDHGGIRKKKSSKSNNNDSNNPSNHENDLIIDDSANHDSVTSRQIHELLTLDERKRIGTKVLAAKLRKGYLLQHIPEEKMDNNTTADAATTTQTTTPNDTAVCDACDMPKLCRSSGKALKSCVVCPVLKKKVFQKLQAAAGQTTSLPTRPATAVDDVKKKRKDAKTKKHEGTTAVFDEIEEARRSLFDESKSRSYYDRNHGCEAMESSSSTRDWNEARNAVARARDVLADRDVASLGEMERRGEIGTAEEGEIENHIQRIEKDNDMVREEGNTSLKLTPRRLFDNDDDEGGNENIIVKSSSKHPPKDTYHGHGANHSPTVTLPPRPPRAIPSKTGKPPLLLPRTTSPSPKHSSNDSICSNASRTRRHRRIDSNSSSNNSLSSSNRSRNSGNTTLASDAQSVASAALLTICDQIELTKEKILKTEDVQEQIAMAELLTKLSAAALAVKKLEKVAGTF
ncbi:hypothetical protein ACHAXS_007796 [Conticribra weissflogii]